ncbi:MAG: hypothetical protein HKN12_07555, partial [Gemmatimonadetes bacterium]|nr:hypothetical protein [Gemmatimonadota bacterium]
KCPADTPVGLASQRSSFLLWDAATRAPVTPVISWQDRRARDWCTAHGGGDAAMSSLAGLSALTGLVLSPHYVGPKVAALREADPALARRLDAGELRIGTLDTWLLDHWSGGRHFRTEATMAARTLLLDVNRMEWSETLGRTFGVPENALPEITASRFDDVAVPGSGRWCATLGDQAAGLLGVAGDDPETAIVNFGTGTFVLRSAPGGDRAASGPRPTGYLLGPSLVRRDAPVRYAWEGSVNGGAAAVDAEGFGPTPVPARDPAPDGFCLPDSAGLGAPHWRGDIALRFSDAVKELKDPDRRRTVLEGLAFRVRAVLDDLHVEDTRRILVCGGLANEPFLPQALAALLPRPVHLSTEPESTLLGIARLAAGREAELPDLGGPVTAPTEASYLEAKYGRWCAWRDEQLGRR